jgi:alpha-N-arabinofuranosidase
MFYQVVSMHSTGAMDHTRITLHPDYKIAPVDSRIFGGFLEHLGRAVYQGVYQPESALADHDGFRSDVLEALKRMCSTALRYPEGKT